jgi:adenosylcobinamide-GDP ribazoletransferase
MAMLILIISVIITGGIHLDGFADTCDGFYGGGHKERVLEIMKDSHIGTIGVAGVVLLLLLKFSLIASFPEGALWKVLTLMSVFSRWSQGFACYAANYARQEGKAKYFIERAKKLDIFSGFLFTLALSYLFLKLDGLILCFVSFLPVFLFFQYIKKKLGGMTGDTIGAISEISEAAVLFFSSILYRINL